MLEKHWIQPGEPRISRVCFASDCTCTVFNLTALKRKEKKCTEFVLGTHSKGMGVLGLYSKGLSKSECAGLMSRMLRKASCIKLVLRARPQMPDLYEQ